MTDATNKTPWTPGPWTVELLLDTMPRIVTARDASIVCRLSKENLESRESNARLIAAAPELYAALDALEQAPENMLNVANARAALAKARGEQVP